MRFLSTVRAAEPRRHVMLGIGASDGTVEVPCALSLYGASSLLSAAGVSVTLCIEAGNCHVDDMRNGIVAQFLKSPCEELIFIDEDVGFRPEDLLRLIRHDRDIVGGVYPKKQDDEAFPVFTEPGTELWSDADGLVEVHGLPTGFLKIRRRVFEELSGDAAAFIGSDGIEYRLFFERTISGGRRWSGDYAFTRKWLARGGQLFVDPWFVLSHTGKKTWVGVLAEYWERAHGLTQERFDQAVEHLRAGQAADFEVLARGWHSEWCASPALLQAIHDNCTGNVLECGSGLSTLVLAAKGCDVTALEHDPVHAGVTRAMLDRYGLKARIVCKPLKDGWYDFEGGAYDALVIDGPPRTIADRSIALQRVTAPLVIWDDYEEEKRFAILRPEAEHA